MNDAELKGFIHSYENFPRPGVTFRDISPLLVSPQAFDFAIRRMILPYLGAKPIFAAIESRGFIFGSAMADRFGAGVVMIRKAGKLPGEVISEEYEKEYGKDKLEIQVSDALRDRWVVVVDDVLATGETVIAAAKLLRRLGARVHLAAFLIHIRAFDGYDKLLQEKICAYSVMDF